MNKLRLLVAILLFSALYGYEEEDLELSALERGDALPSKFFEQASDPFLEGYIQALIDTSYYEYQVIVLVRNRQVILSNLPKNELIAKSILSFVQDIPGIISVEVEGQLTEESSERKSAYTKAPKVSGIWFPQSTVLFLPLIADPREPVYSVNYRVGDSVVGRKAIAVSLGDDFPIFRWNDLWRWHGDLQIGISAGVWALFNFSHVPNPQQGPCELVNSDYLVGIPLTYAFDQWSFRGRVYHISGHLGDEYMVDYPLYLNDPKARKNPSFEAVDLISSYQFSSGVRLYGGPGYLFAADNSFPIKPFYIIWGTEMRFLGRKLYYHRLYGTPFFALHLENWQQWNWHCDLTLKLGYEISKLQGVGRKMRLYFQYHNGFSYEGQFFGKATSYGELGLSWGF